MRTVYYPFGMVMPGRSNSSGAYRFGFNGKENDNEVKGSANQQDYGMRIYDPRLGRFFTVDPYTRKFPYLSPYQFAENNPIWAIDLDGLESQQKNINDDDPRNPLKGVDVNNINEQAIKKQQAINNFVNNLDLPKQYKQPGTLENSAVQTQVKKLFIGQNAEKVNQILEIGKTIKELYDVASDFKLVPSVTDKVSEGIGDAVARQLTRTLYIKSGGKVFSETAVSFFRFTAFSISEAVSFTIAAGISPLNSDAPGNNTMTNEADKAINKFFNPEPPYKKEPLISKSVAEPDATGIKK